MFLTMADTFSTELDYATERRAHWQAKYLAALTIGDTEQAAHAMEHLRQYDWLISWMEGVHEPD